MSNGALGYQIRTYRGGDEEEFVKLFNNVYKDYAGFVPRTTESWLWCCKNRPGVQGDGIIVVEIDGKVTGYAVVTDSGDILEFCYDPEHADKEIVLKLLERIENYVKNAGASSITLHAPLDDFLLREACKESGFAESSPPYALQLSVIDFPQLVKVILTKKIDALKAWSSEKILLKLRHPPLGYEHVTLTISDGNLWVERERTEKADLHTAIIETDTSTLMSCIFGNMKLWKAFFALKIRVSPFWKLPRVWSLFSLLKLNDPWYAPGGDYS